MVWNEPDNSGKDDKNRRKGNNNPWGNANNEGPPDLDEALNKMKEQMSGIFGGKGSGNRGSSSQSPQLSMNMIFIILAALLAVWFFSGWYQLDEKERAVILRLGKYHDTVEPGLHWNPPFVDQRFVVLVTQEQDYQTRGLMLTKDENIVEVPISVQYKIPDPKSFVLNVRDPITSLKHATDSALRHVVGGTKASDVLSDGRELMADETQTRLQSYLDRYQTGIAITRVNILKAEPPSAVKASFDDVIEAKEDKDRFVNEAQAYANGVVPEARGRAQRILQEAIAYREKVVAEAKGDAERFDQLFAEYIKAPEVTRERLYLDAVESVMTNSSKVLVDVEGGNNLMYLPLDKLASQPVTSGRGGGSQEDIVNQVADRVIEQLRMEQSRVRRSGGR